jgi:hypothetical protein
LHLYSYTDFDLAGTNEDDSVSFPTNNLVLQQGKGATATQSVQGQTPNYWEASWYAFTLDKIDAGTPAVLADDIDPDEPGDQTFAYQWDVSLGAGQTFVLNLTNSIQMSLPVLTITLSGSNAIVSWPTNDADGLNLQSSSSLNAGMGWTNVPFSQMTVGTNYQVTVPLAGSGQFYRLNN